MDTIAINPEHLTVNNHLEPSWVRCHHIELKEHTVAANFPPGITVTATLCGRLILENNALYFFDDPLPDCPDCLRIIAAVHQMKVSRPAVKKIVSNL